MGGALLTRASDRSRGVRAAGSETPAALGRLAGVEADLPPGNRPVRAGRYRDP